MGGGGRDDPPPTSSNDGGEFLLSLLQRPSHPHRHSQPPRPQPQAQAQPQRHHPHPAQSLTLDPAVAAVGPAVNFPGPSNGHDLSPPWPHTLSPPLAYPHAYFGVAPQVPSQGLSFDDLRRLALGGHDFRGIAPQSQSLPHQSKQQLHHQHQPQREHKFLFGSLPSEIRLSDSLSSNNLNFDSAREHKVAAGNRSHDRFEQNHQVNPRGYSYSDVNASRRDKDEFPEREMRALGLGKQNPSGNHGHALPGFSTKPRGRGDSGLGNRRTGFVHNVDQEKDNRSELDHKNAGLYGEGVRRFQFNDHRMPSKRSGEIRLSAQLDHPGPPSGSNLLSASASDVENVHFEVDEEESKGVEGEENKTRGTGGGDASEFEIEQFNDSLLTEGGVNEKNEKSQHRTHREKDFRSDSRGQRVLSQRMRNYRRSTECRRDIDTLNTAFLAIYDSLIPPEEEMAKQKQLLALLEKLVNKEWSEAQLYLYGSCANSFGVCKSDIDVCLAIQDPEIDKSEVLLKLADILQSGNLQNVQALTRARVPIVKLMDPATGISCDICINNVLAVVNTKLLRDYAQIDVRLRQLAFIVKHWAKSRGVNETYQGTLSSYAYVLMCIHFLQQRRPAILPCLQEMGATYSVTVDDIKCSYFDQVEKLRDFGSRNKETIAQLVWAFFNYWAYCHDYTSSVISVRTGSLLSKQSKDWTRRIGNDRHLICIEDPFDTSHDLGRVVDKFSIKVLREEFERAAEIMQYDRNPCETLFEPYVAS